MPGSFGENTFGDDDYDGAEPTQADELTPGGKGAEAED